MANIYGKIVNGILQKVTTSIYVDGRQIFWTQEKELKKAGYKRIIVRDFPVLNDDQKAIETYIVEGETIIVDWEIVALSEEEVYKRNYNRAARDLTIDKIIDALLGDKDALEFLRERKGVKEENLNKLPSPEWVAGVEVSTGQRYSYNGKTYEVIQSHRTQSTWTPSSVPALYKLLRNIEDVELDKTPDWKQPDGGHDAYSKDSEVLHKNKKWKSSVDANVWEPGVYGWDEIK